MNYDMITPVVYSHTDYELILKIQTEYFSIFKNKHLFINNNHLPHHQEILSQYDNVSFYEDTLPYASRVLKCLNNITTEYILFTHDIDIILHCDFTILAYLTELMQINHIDRIDLKHWLPLPNENMVELDFDIKLVQQKNPENYIYNVNPSIWRVETFKKLLSTFSDRTYRNIESYDVQEWLKKYDVYKIFKTPMLKCGYYNCVDFYKFLHITHSGKFLPLNTELLTEMNQSYADIAEDYRHIVKRFNLESSDMWRD